MRRAFFITCRQQLRLHRQAASGCPSLHGPTQLIIDHARHSAARSGWSAISFSRSSWVSTRSSWPNPIGARPGIRVRPWPGSSRRASTASRHFGLDHALRGAGRNRAVLKATRPVRASATSCSEMDGDSLVGGYVAKQVVADAPAATCHRGGSGCGRSCRPARALFSTRSTGMPRSARCRAAVRPDSPPPTTSGRFLAGQFFSAATDSSVSDAGGGAAQQFAGLARGLLGLVAVRPGAELAQTRQIPAGPGRCRCAGGSSRTAAGECVGCRRRRRCG